MSGLATIGRYEVIATIGRGAMGVVYKAKDPKLDRTVAIKVLNVNLGSVGADDEELRDRFELEARALARLGQNPHPNIVGIFDMGEVEGAPYLVMEYVDGSSLEVALRRGKRFGVEPALTIGLQICSALDYMHSRQILHRDIKPANVMMTEGGAAKLTDFGIARVGPSTMTKTGQLLGTPSYMSPEQFQAQELDRRSDIFSLGAVLYELLTGDRAFPGESITAIQHRVLNDDPPPPSRLNAHLSGVRAVDELIAKALAKRPSRRFQSAREFGDAIRRCLALLGSGDETQFGQVPTERRDTRTAIPDGGSERAAWRRPAVLAGGAGVIITALVGGFYMMRGGGLGRNGDGVPAAAVVIAQTPQPTAGPNSQEPVSPSQPVPTRRLPTRTVQTPPGPSGSTQPAIPTPLPPIPRSIPDGVAAPSGLIAAAPSSVPSTAPLAGLLNINASPWAYVELDGLRLNDTTPMVGLKLAPGTHRVTVFRDGYERETRTIEVKSGQQEYLSFDLKPR